jgi:endonuclease-3
MQKQNKTKNQPSAKTNEIEVRAKEPSAARSDLKKIIPLLSREYPGAKTALIHENPLELIVATILSAQCTDVRVNIVTKELFKKYRTASDYASADLAAFEKEIHSTGFYHNKAKNIIGMAKTLIEKFGGNVPRTMEELMTLPGVARKTANVVMAGAFGIAAGITVDTHVFRLSHRIGLSDGKNPEKVEQDLIEIAPKEDWISFSHLLIFHGRNVCDARKPLCEKCVISRYCEYFKIQ